MRAIDRGCYRLAKLITKVQRTAAGQLVAVLVEAWRWQHDVTPVLDVAFGEDRRKRARTPKWK